MGVGVNGQVVGDRHQQMKIFALETPTPCGGFISERTMAWRNVGRL
jgi:hypothetical protein